MSFRGKENGLDVIFINSKMPVVEKNKIRAGSYIKGGSVEPDPVT